MTRNTEGLSPFTAPPAVGARGRLLGANLARLRTLTAGSVNRRILGATLTVGALMTATALATAVQDVVVAAHFGTSGDLDAFLVAFVLPSTVGAVIGSSFGPALLPVYVEVRERGGRSAAESMLSGVVTAGSGVLVLACAALILVGPRLLPLLTSGFAPDQVALTQRLFYVLVPTVVGGGLAGLWRAILHADERFAIATLAPSLVPLGGAVVLAVASERWGIAALAYGVVAGSALQMALLMWSLRRQGQVLWPRRPRSDRHLHRVARQYAGMLTGAVVFAATVPVNQAFAAATSSGGVAALSFGSKLAMLFLALGTAALGTGVFPYFSKMVAAEDWVGVRHSLRTYERLVLGTAVVVTGVACLLSAPIVRPLYQRGAFTADDTILVSQIQAIFLLQVPFQSVAMLYFRLVSSLQANHLLTQAAVIGLVLTIILDWLLLSALGIAGIAVATVVVSAAICAYMAFVSHRRLRQMAA